MNIQDRRKTLTAEELRRRYNLDALDKDRKAIKLQKDQLTKVDAELNDFVEITTKNLKELQNQVDGNITTWFFNGVPRVENEPSSNWTTEEEKINHLGDLYYDQDTGYAYRWAYENNIYVWSKIVDADVVEALAVANAAQDTADSKRRVFVVQPKPPYDIGDIWIKEDTDLYRCRASRSEGNFNTADWTRATNYTDDAVALGTKAELDQFKTQVTENYVSNATLETTTNSIEAKVTEVYEYTTTVEDTVSGLSESVSNTIENVSKLTTDVDGITSRVSSTETKIEDITTTTQTSTGGNTLHIIDALESNALEYHIEGKSEQETRSGKNLLDLSNNQNSNGITSVLNADGSLSISGTATSTWSNITSNKTQKILAGTYIISTNILHSYQTVLKVTYVDGTTKEFWLNALSRGVTFTQDVSSYYVWLFVTSGTTYSDTLYLQLESGTTVSEYEQYGVSPSPDYPSEIKTVKGIENLFNKDDVFFNKQWNGNSLVESEVANASPKIPVIGGKKYKRNVGYNANIFIKNDGSVVDIQGGTNTIVAPENSKYWVFNIPKEVDVNTIIAVQGDTISDYVPYGAWAKVKITGKNFLPVSTVPTTTANGITFTNNGDGTYTLSGTATNLFAFDILKNITLSSGTYTLSGCPSGGSTTTYELRLGTTSSNRDYGNSKTLTLPSEITYDTVRIVIRAGVTINATFKPMLEEGSTATNFEAYKEKEVLIDLSKPNLFTSDIEVGSWHAETGEPNDVTTAIRSADFIPVELNTTYTLKNNKGYNFFMLCFDENKTWSGLINNSTSKYVFTPTTTKYIKIATYISDNITDTDVEFKLFEGYTDYYELSSIGDIKDELSIINGQAVIDKKIGKIVLDGSESWKGGASASTSGYRYLYCTGYPQTPNNFNIMCNKLKPYTSGALGSTITVNTSTIGSQTSASDNLRILFDETLLDDISTGTLVISSFKTWLSNNPVTVKYILAEPKQIILPNVQIPLFEDINHIALVDDLETTTSIKYYRNTPIAQDYVIQQQLDETNSNLSTTTDKTNQNASDISATNTNLNNNYYNKDQIDVMNTSTQEIVTQIKNQVETTTTATNLQISILQEQLTNGVTSVRTETGYTFDKDGLKIQKSDSEMSSLLDNDGLVVKRNETEVLTVRSNGVETENLTVRTYFTIGDNTRVENYKDGTGFFYIGGAN